jgi:hypothetical protein
VFVIKSETLGRAIARLHQYLAARPILMDRYLLAVERALQFQDRSQTIKVPVTMERFLVDDVLQACTDAVSGPPPHVLSRVI